MKTSTGNRILTTDVGSHCIARVRFIFCRAQGPLSVT
jgi:hypothetical protein